MGCGSSTPATKDGAPIEQAHTATLESTGQAGTKATTSGHNSGSDTAKRQAPLPTSRLVPVEFGLVKGLEYGDKAAPALLVVQVSCTRHFELVKFC